jgi:hypothetical protein
MLLVPPYRRSDKGNCQDWKQGHAESSVYHVIEFPFLLQLACVSFCLHKKLYASNTKQRAKKRSSHLGRNGLFRIGLHFKIIFIIANTLPKASFNLSFILLAFKYEALAALPAADHDFDFEALHKHPPLLAAEKQS